MNRSNASTSKVSKWQRRREEVKANKNAGNYANSPMLSTPTPAWRSKFLVGLMGLAFLGLVGRAVWIQIVNNQFYLNQGKNRYERHVDLLPSRGLILDRHGEMLATSVPATSVWLDPKDFNADAKQRKALLRLLDMKASELSKKASRKSNFVWLRRQLDVDDAKAIAALKIPGLYQINESRRIYPEGESTAHIVGFTGVENNGQEGIELTYNTDLAGRKGQKHVIKDRLGNVVDNASETVPAKNGLAIRLSIDAKVQAQAYQRIRDAVLSHGAAAGSVVVLDAVSGEVLALANVPSFTPENRKNLTGAQLRNRALTDTFEPGSTMKPFVVARALEAGLVTPSSRIDTSPGSIQIGGSTIRDSHPHGVLSVTEVIQKSSNVGTVKIAMRMQPRDLWEVYSAVGFGRKPQIGFPGAATGRLRAWKNWRPIEYATMSYGYGLSASLLQIAQAYTVFARDGDMAPISLIKRELASESSQAVALGLGNAFAAAPDLTVQRVSGQQIFKPEVAYQIRQMLAAACAEGGTAPKARAMGYSVGGKTGTAHKQQGKGYATDKYRAWFVGIAPISNPRIVVAVMVDEPAKGGYYGGEVAAPVFSEVVQYTLNRLGVMPDQEVRTRIANVPAVEESF